MKTFLPLLLAGTLGFLGQADAIQLIPISENAENGSVTIDYAIQNTDQIDSNTFLSNEAITFQFTFEIGPDAEGQDGQLFLAAKYDDAWYQKSADGNWHRWNQDLDSLQPYIVKTLQKNETVSVIDEQSLPAGEYLVYAGYRSAQSDALYFNERPASLVVFGQHEAALHRVKNKALLDDLFAHGNRQPPIFYIDDMATTTFAETAGDGGNAVSQTNLQETGVDEGDRIKTDGEYLFVLEACAADSTKQCVGAYAISSQPAGNQRLDQLDVDGNAWQQDSLYLTAANGSETLLQLSDSMSYPIYATRSAPGYWLNNRTDIRWIDVNQPDNLQSGTHITLDSTLISSRLIDGVLYLVTRKSAYFNEPRIVPFDQIVATTAQDGSQAPLEQQDIATLLPTLSFNDGSEPAPLVAATDCFIPSQNSAKPFENSIVTVTAIPVDNPSAHYSACVTGNVDTFYMSQDALYLATSRYPYTIDANRTIVYEPGQYEMSTELHKFALGDGSLDYRGSGSVPGHLGWNSEKQPFRLGEYQGILKVATSKGNTWNGSSTTRVAVLQEDADSHSLAEIAFLDNLGKPNEQLFAARFIQNRGYLVTFLQTDPLFVLDFSDPHHPQQLGELQIQGYSDYLHPIGENYLLGIGKDAIPTPDAERGALYQGLKLSLFDVSDGQNLREVKSLVIGKRGSQSAVLQDHHALAWLAAGDAATLAIPVQLNDRESANALNFDPNYYSQPGAYYDWTHTGLYTFKVDTGANPDLSLLGRLITDTVENRECKQPESFESYCYNPGQSTYNDRVVIQNDSVHYIHNNGVYSSSIDDLD